MKASNISRKNKIKKLKLEDGSTTENNKEMKGIASGFFKNLYKKEVEVNSNPIFELFQPSVMEEMNNDLL
jgi:hypothetical protein